VAKWGKPHIILNWKMFISRWLSLAIISVNDYLPISFHDFKCGKQISDNSTKKNDLEKIGLTSTDNDLQKKCFLFGGKKLANFEPFLIKFVKAKLIQNNSKSA
jgi:hypothetical protein